MPTYDYQCQACQHRFEVFQGITEGALRRCPKCKRLKLKRLIGTGAGFIFKGSGFYITDYRSSSYKDAAKKEGTSGSNGSESPSDGATKADGEKKSKDSKNSKKGSKGSSDS